MAKTAPELLAVEDLTVSFAGRGAPIEAVRGVSLKIEPAECVAVVGESGSGKTQLFMAAMRLLPANARARGAIRFAGESLLPEDAAVLRRIRGQRLCMVFQDPMSALTPHLSIGTQLTEVLATHQGLSRTRAWSAAQGMLERVQVPEPARRMRQYPHQLSGGLRQRVLIGMALLTRPELLIADEPTTALDVTLQAEIMSLLRDMRREFGLALVLISHDLGVVAEIADRILVMYAGRIVESAACRDLFRAPRHPYTAELIRCMPRMSGALPPRMATLAGNPPRAEDSAAGCAFAPRCPRAQARCLSERPGLTERMGRAAACHFPLEP